jgi:hypothetical protein
MQRDQALAQVLAIEEQQDREDDHRERVPTGLAIGTIRSASCPNGEAGVSVTATAAQ